MNCDVNPVDDGFDDICVLYFCVLWWKISGLSLNMHATLVMNEMTICDATHPSTNVNKYHTKQYKTW